MGFDHLKAYAMCGRSDAAMLSCHLCMDGWILRNHSIARDHEAPLRCLHSTTIVIWRWEFNVMAIERLLTILQQDDTHNSVGWDGEMGSKTISGRLSGCNLGRHHLEYEMHLPDDCFHTWYPVYSISLYAYIFDWLGNVLPRTTF